MVKNDLEATADDGPRTASPLGQWLTRLRQASTVRGRRSAVALARLTVLATLTACQVPVPAPEQALEGQVTVAVPLLLEASATPVPATPETQPTVPGLAPMVPQARRIEPQSFAFPSPVAFATPVNWRPPLEEVPLAARPQDHFWLARPIASDSVNWPLGSYRYGSDYFGQMNIHAGIDIDAPQGTPILASGPGTVIWAGWGLFNFDPRREDDPYGIAVAIRHDFGYQNQPVYTLYAHMEQHNIGFVGQRVQTGDILGWVGSTGNSTGPHVHFEVRVGRNDYYSTRNPELWIAPYAGWGVLAGRLVTERGNFIPSTPIEIYDQDGDWLYTVFTYGPRVAKPDDDLAENFAISDLPAGRYYLRAMIGLNAPPPFIINPINPPPQPTSPLPRPTNDELAGIAGVVAPGTVATLTPTAATTAASEGEEEDEITFVEGWVEVIPGQTNFVILRENVGLTNGAPPQPTMTAPAP